MSITSTTNSSSGTSSISGLVSGLDWQSIISQLKTVEHQPIDLVTTKQTNEQKQLTEWQSFNTTLLSLKTAAGDISDPDNFNAYTSEMTSDSSTLDAEDLISVSASSTASPGSYSIKVNNLATAQKLSSTSFSSSSDALGSAYSGDIIINGKAISITNTDGLLNIRDRINNANSGTNPTGVTASIISYGSNDYRLILTSDDTGAEGITIQNGSSGDLLELFGWKDGSSTIKNSITNGVQSDMFSSSTQDIKTLLGLSSTQSGTIKVNGQNVAINLSTDSLEDIKTNINSLGLEGVSASVISKTDNGTTTYALEINGTQSFVDSQNILETLGIVTNGVSDVQGIESANKMTEDGDIISSGTLLSDIDGYNSWTSGDSISISGKGHNGDAISGSTFTITSSSTVQDLLDAIKSAFNNKVTAHVTSDGKIEVDDLEAGTSSMTLSLSSTINDGSTLDWGAFGVSGTVRKRELVAGQDASLTVDGVEITSKDNSIEDSLPGVTLDLKKADEDTTVTLSVARDLTAVTDKIQSFVTAYNAVASYISEQQTYDSSDETTGGALFGDGTLSSIQSDLSSILVKSVSGVSSDFSILGLVGIHLDNEGQLSIDSDELNGFLKTNFNDIQQLFSADGTTNSGALKYVSSTNDTNAGDYAVNITQAATKNTSTGDTIVSGTLGADETLTITDGDKTATISLTSGMSISDIVNAVNTELDTAYSEKLVGDTAVKAGNVAVDSTTTWDAIDGADLLDGDTIKFTGTTRKGINISGSYTIDDTSVDTIQGLLSDIESSFGDDVSASIDTSGHLVLTDNYEGSSKLSLTLDYTETNSTDIFGSVLTDNEGGQEGRYAMAITAANDGSNRLMLSNNSYGSSYSFIVAEDRDDGLWTGSKSNPVSVNNGKTVAGTINGKAATGSGQTLTGNDGEADIAGLVIKYTGSTTGNIGNIKFTVGVAELFNRALYNITDSEDGYLTFKQNSISAHIKDMDDDIDKMEARLTIKMTNMTARFEAMELALSKLQNMSSWLSSQITAASSGWASL